ncbi:hypothetical protein ACFUN7_24410 [Streptomyces sp. NPDC057236]|uniref:hypothetical protein n=1 Tax=Streptomyces sp. NPDC057236 TaxID=3346059 RepID=UPI0036357DEC
MSNPTPARHTCHDQKAAPSPAWQCLRCSVPSPAGQAPAPSVQAEAVLRVVEAALGDTLVASARDEALAGIAAVLNASMPADQAAVLSDCEKAMLGFALEMAQEEIHARSLEFTADDKAALDSLRRMADETPAETADVRAAREALYTAATGTGIDLDAIAARATDVQQYGVEDDAFEQLVREDVPALISEVRHLRAVQASAVKPTAESTEPRPCRTFVSGGSVWCCEEGETDCSCVCHEPAAGARQNGEAP